MLRLRKYLFFAIFLCSISAQAQGSIEDICDKAEQLIWDYRFNDAEKVLSSVTEDQEENRLDTLKRQAVLGKRMLQTVIDIDLTDSLVIPRSEILQTIPRNTDGGRHVRISDIKGLTGNFQGETAYINGLNDAVFVSALDNDGTAKISIVRKLGNNWQEPQPIEGLGDEFEEPRNPFVNADGTMLWFVARGKESLGGYDIFVTRYDSGMRRYLKPQNIGMPFNSPYDELLYTIDEERGMGYFLTGRGTSEDSITLCLFKIIEAADFLSEDSIGAEGIRNFAALKDVPFIRQGEAREIIKEWNRLAAESNPSMLPAPPRLIISDDCVLTDTEELKSARARRIAGEWVKESLALEEQKKELENLRHIYNKGMPEMTQRILDLEGSIQKSTLRIKDMEMSIRQLELNSNKQNY